jgi:hypothetical protein
VSRSRDAEYSEYVAARLSSLRRLAAVLCDDWQRADDLVQATLIKLYVHWGRVATATHPDAYARAVLVRESIHERRSVWVKRVSLSGTVTGPSAAAVDQDAVLDLRAAVAALPPRQRATLVLGVYARGQCHLTGSASVLNCPGSKLPIRQRAPDVAGRRAFWGSPFLVWQYARGGWAVISVPAPNLSAVLYSKQGLAGQALKIASHVRYGVPTPLVFPARFSGLPSQWQVHNISYYVPDGGLLRADQYMLTTGSSRFHPRVGDTGVWTDAPYIIVNPALRKSTCTPHDPATQNTSEIINGYRVVLKRFHIGGLPVQELCGAHAGGLAVDIQVFGAHPSINVASLFRDHMRLLGTNPANWTSNPIG